MATTRVPRVARIHFDSVAGVWRAFVSWLDEFTQGGEAGELVNKLLTLAQIIQFIVDTWGAPPTGVESLPTGLLGDMGGLAQHLIQTFHIVGHAPVSADQQTMAGRIDVPGQGYWEWHNYT